MTTATVPRFEKTDHRPYIETVRISLLLGDINATVPTFNTGKVRSAAMTLLPPDNFDDPWAYTFASAERVELQWNEENGWSLLALHTARDGRLPTIWRRGFEIVLPPDEVYTWLSLLLTMPAFSSSREDGPFRSHQHHDPALEAALASYCL